jgi:hypothetical protein
MEVVIQAIVQAVALLYAMIAVALAGLALQLIGLVAWKLWPNSSVPKFVTALGTILDLGVMGYYARIMRDT